MKCPFCQSEGTKVIDSRTSSDNSVRRRRECLTCERRFTTYEKIEENPLRVIKKDGSREGFQREKLRQGFRLACSKRPVTSRQIEEMIEAIERDLAEQGPREVPTHVIGQRAEEELRSRDPIAYFRFRTVHREIPDIDSLVDELEPMRESAGNPDPNQQSLFN